MSAFENDNKKGRQKMKKGMNKTEKKFDTVTKMERKVLYILSDLCNE